MPGDCTTVLKFLGYLQLMYIQKLISRICANLRIYGVIGILVSVEKSWSIGEVVASVGVLVVWLVWDGGVGWWGMLWGCLGKVPKTSQVGECPDFFLGGDSPF